jgi:hypothetical protein
MTSAVAAFGIAVGGTSLISYLLMTRLQNRRASRGSSGGSGVDGGDYGGGDGWSLSHWFGGGDSALDPSGNPIDFGGDSGGGGGDSGGGGDGGGDGGGGGD